MALLDPVLEPLLGGMEPIWLIVCASFVLTIIITLIYKFTTDQPRIKELREETKSLQKELRTKELQENKELFEIKQKKLTQNSMEMMKQNFRPMIFTMIPVFLILGWMTGHLSLEALEPGEFFSVDVYTEPGFTGAVHLEHDEIFIDKGNEKTPVDGKTFWRLRGDKPGRYILGFTADGVLAEKAVRISDRLEYEKQAQTYDDGPIQRIEIQQDKLTPLGDFTVFNWKPGWLAVYIFISIAMSILIRKVLGVH